MEAEMRREGVALVNPAARAPNEQPSSKQPPRVSFRGGIQFVLAL